MKIARPVACDASNESENIFERNISSPINRQFTVHLKRNCRVNSKALKIYPAGFS